MTRLRNKRTRPPINCVKFAQLISTPPTPPLPSPSNKVRWRRDISEIFLDAVLFGRETDVAMISFLEIAFASY